MPDIKYSDCNIHQKINVKSYNEGLTLYGKCIMKHHKTRSVGLFFRNAPRYKNIVVRQLRKGFYDRMMYNIPKDLIENKKRFLLHSKVYANA